MMGMLDDNRLTREDILSGSPEHGVMGIRSDGTQYDMFQERRRFYDSPVSLSGEYGASVVGRMFSHGDDADKLAFVPQGMKPEYEKWVGEYSELNGIPEESARTMVCMAAYYNSFSPDGKGRSLKFCLDNVDMLAKRAGDGENACEAWKSLSDAYAPAVPGEGGYKDALKAGAWKAADFGFNTAMFVATLPTKLLRATDEHWTGAQERGYQDMMAEIADLEGFIQERAAANDAKALSSEVSFWKRLGTLEGWNDLAKSVVSELPRHILQVGVGWLGGGPVPIFMESAMQKELELRREMPGESENLYFWNSYATGAVNSAMYEMTLGLLKGKIPFRIGKLFPSTRGGQIAAYAAGAAASQFVEETAESEMEYGVDVISGVRPLSDWRQAQAEALNEGGMAVLLSPFTAAIGISGSKSRAQIFVDAVNTKAELEKVSSTRPLSPVEKLALQTASNVAESYGTPPSDAAVSAYVIASEFNAKVDDAKRKISDKYFMNASGEIDIDAYNREIELAGKGFVKGDVLNSESDEDVKARRQAESANAILSYKTMKAMPVNADETIREVRRLAKLFPEGLRYQVDTGVTWESLPFAVREEAKARGYSREDLPRYMPVRGGIWINGDKVHASEVKGILAHGGAAREWLVRKYGDRARDAALKIYEKLKDDTAMMEVVSRTFGDEFEPSDSEKVECVVQLLSDRTADYMETRPGAIEKIKVDLMGIFRGDPAFGDNEMTDADIQRLVVSLVGKANGRIGKVVGTKSGFAAEDLEFVAGLGMHIGAEVEIATADMWDELMENGARAAGVALDEFVKSGTRVNGYYRNEDGKVFLAPGADPRMAAGHEFMHFLKNNAREVYDALEDTIWSSLTDKATGEVLEDTAELYKGMSRDDIVEEFMADRLGDIVASPEFAKSFADYVDRKHAGMGRRILLAIRDFLRRAMDFVARRHGDGTEEFRDIASAADSVSRILAEYDPRGEHVPYTHNENDSATQVRQKALGRLAAGKEGAKSVDDSFTGQKLSMSQTLVGGGLKYEYNQDGSVTVRHSDGRKVTDRSPVTADEILKGDNPFTRVMKYAEGRTMTGEQVEKVAELYAQICNKGIQYVGEKTNGAYMLDAIWRWAGASVFKSIKNNGDAQYSLSIDLTTICKKTEQLVNALSEWQVKNGRGADAATVMQLYLETGKAGYQTPCPCCYVFSHWIRGGMLLETARRAEERYGMHLKTRDEMARMPDQEKRKLEKFWRDELARQQKLAEDNKTNIQNAKELLDASMVEADSLVERLLAQESRRERGLDYSQETIDMCTQGINDLSRHISDAYNSVAESDFGGWIKSCVMPSIDLYKKDKKGNVVKDEKTGLPVEVRMYDDWRPVPPEILFDITRAAEMVGKFPHMARFRVSKGSAGGKAIETYADNAFGDVVSGMSGDLKIPKTDLETGIESDPVAFNPFLDGGDENRRRDKFQSAVVWQARQALRGGQRIFSWSDNMVSMGPDMFLNFVQLQAVGGAVQSYSKQLEGARLIASMGGYNNASLMAYGNGFVECEPGAVARWETDVVDGMKVKHYLGNPVEIDGKWYQPDFSRNQGIDAELTFGLNHELDKSGNIIVGMNARHVQVCLASDDIFFCIPWHASGLRQAFLNMMMDMLGEHAGTSAVDHTNVQDDKAFDKKDRSTDLTDTWARIAGELDAAGRRYRSCFEVNVNADGTLSDTQLKYREIFQRIILGDATDKDMAYAKDDEFLGQTVRKLKEAAERAERFGGNPPKDSHGLLKMTSDDAKSIYPYMYWDENTHYKKWDGERWTGESTMDENGFRYLEFCRRLGFVPKFCGLSTGGRKVLAGPEGSKVQVGDYHNFKGYAKLLIDRRMYDNNGNYQDTTPVNATGMTLDMITREGTEERWGKKNITRVANRADARRIADAVDAKRTGDGYSVTMSRLTQEDGVFEIAAASNREFNRKMRKGVYNPDAPRKEEKAKKKGKMSIVKDPVKIAELESAETVTRYRAMQLIDGKLYPPMAAKVNGKLVHPVGIGDWVETDIPDSSTIEEMLLSGQMRRNANGKMEFKLDKANGKHIWAAYNPYLHTSTSMLNDQFSSAYSRPNLVVVEVEVPASELAGAFRAPGAKDSVGDMNWHSGPVATKLKDISPRTVTLSRWCKLVRVVPDQEVARSVAPALAGNGVKVPGNVVTPSLSKALEAEGVDVVHDHGGKFSLSRVTPKQDADYMDAVKRGDMDTAQRMVDEAAFDAAAAFGADGSNIVAYRGDGMKFNEWDNSRGALICFTTDKSEAEAYARRSYARYGGVPDGHVGRYFILSNDILDWKRVTASVQGELFQRFVERNGLEEKYNKYKWLLETMKVYANGLYWWETTTVDKADAWRSLIAPFLIDWGYDGISYPEDGGNMTIALFEQRKSLAKSAEPVTYDNRGNVVPLSMRFDRVMNDMRFSLSRPDKAGDVPSYDSVLQRYSDIEVTEIAKMLQPALDQAKGLDAKGMRAWLASMGVNVRSDRDMRYFVRLARGFREEDDARVAKARLKTVKDSGGRPVTIEERREVARLVIPMAEKKMKARQVVEELAKDGISVTEKEAEAFIRNAVRIAGKNYDEKQEEMINAIVDLPESKDVTPVQRLDIQAMMATLAPDMPSYQVGRFTERIMRLGDIPLDASDRFPQGRRRAEAERIISDLKIAAEKVQRDKARGRMLELVDRHRSTLTRKGIMTSELGGDSQETVDRISEILKMREEAVQAQILYAMRILQENESDGRDVFQAFGRRMTPDELRRQLHLLQTFGLPNAPLADIGRAEAELNEIIETGRDEWSRKAEKKRIAARRDADAVKRGLGESPTNNVSVRPEDEAESSNLKQMLYRNMDLRTLLVTAAGRKADDFENSVPGKILESIDIADEAERDAEFEESRLFSEETARVVGSERLIDIGRFFRDAKEERDTGIDRRIFKRSTEDEKDVTLSYLTVGMRGRSVVTISSSTARKALADFDASGRESVEFTTENGRSLVLDRMNAEFVRRQITDMDAKLDSDYDLSADPEENAKLNKQINDARKAGEVKIVMPPKEEQFENRRMVMSKGQALQAVLTWDQPDARAIMMWNGWSQDIIDRLKSFCGQDVLRLGYWMRQTLADGREDLDKVVFDRFGAHMPTVENYFPTKFLGAGRAGNTEKGKSGIPKAMETGFLVKRKFHTNDIDTSADAFKVFRDAVRNQRHFIAMSETMAHANRVLFSQDVKSAFVNSLGKDYLTQLQDRMAMVEGGGRINDGDELTSRLLGAFVPSALAFNASSAIKQSLSFGAYLNGVSAKDFASAMREVAMRAPDYRKFLYVALNSEYLKDRAKSGWAADVKIAMARSDNPYTRMGVISQALNRAGFWAMGMGDRFSAITGGYAVYKSAYESSKANGATEEAARKTAFDAWTRQTDRTQQSSRLMDQNFYQSGGAGAWGRMGTMFLSNPIQIMNVELEEFAKAAALYRKGDKSAAARKVLRTAAINHLLMPSMMLFVSEMFRHGVGDMWDEAEVMDLLSAWMLGPFESFFLLGRLAGLILSGGSTYSNGSDPTLAIVNDALTGAKELADGDLGERDAEALANVFSGVGIGAGFVSPELGDAITGVSVPAGAVLKQTRRAGKATGLGDDGQKKRR